jgi:hypothetical protein
MLPCFHFANRLEIQGYLGIEEDWGVLQLGDLLRCDSCDVGLVVVSEVTLVRQGSRKKVYISADSHAQMLHIMPWAFSLAGRRLLHRTHLDLAEMPTDHLQDWHADLLRAVWALVRRVTRLEELEEEDVLAGVPNSDWGEGAEDWVAV